MKRLSELRGSLVHFNFQQLRTYYNLPKNVILERHKGKVFALALEKGETVNLSGELSESQREMQSIYAWFLEGTNSALLEDILKEFDKSIRQIDTLVELKAISFDERASFYQKVIFQGKMLSSEECDTCRTWMKSFPPYKNKDPEDFLARVNDSFNLS